MNNIPIYLINLDTDKDRLEFMDEQFKALDISYERFPAIRGTQMSEWLKPYFLDEAGDIASSMTVGEIGCYASHLALMRIAADSNQSILVFEDDVQIKLEFPELLDELARLDAAYDILRISSIRKKRIAITKAELSGGYKIVRYLRVPMNSATYIITPEGARKFLDWKLLRTSAIDLDLQRVWEHKLYTVGVSPEPVIRNILESTINKIQPRIKLRKSRLAKVTDGARRLAYLCLS